jgi:hypothetical protein
LRENSKGLLFFNYQVHCGLIFPRQLLLTHKHVENCTISSFLEKKLGFQVSEILEKHCSTESRDDTCASSPRILFAPELILVLFFKVRGKDP